MGSLAILHDYFVGGRQTTPPISQDSGFIAIDRLLSYNYVSSSPVTFLVNPMRPDLVYWEDAEDAEGVSSIKDTALCFPSRFLLMYR